VERHVQAQRLQERRHPLHHLRELAERRLLALGALEEGEDVARARRRAAAIVRRLDRRRWVLAAHQRLVGPHPPQHVIGLDREALPQHPRGARREQLRLRGREPLSSERLAARGGLLGQRQVRPDAAGVEDVAGHRDLPYGGARAPTAPGHVGAQRPEVHDRRRGTAQLERVADVERACPRHRHHGLRAAGVQLGGAHVPEAARRRAQRGVQDLPRGLAEDGCEELLLGGQHGASAWCDLADQQAARADGGAHADQAALVEVLESRLAHVGDVARQLLGAVVQHLGHHLEGLGVVAGQPLGEVGVDHDEPWLERARLDARLELCSKHRRIWPERGCAGKRRGAPPRSTSRHNPGWPRPSGVFRPLFTPV
jgi:hypothetical protein